MPQGASRQVELPYSETTSIDEMPAYYSFDDYVVKLESDLSKAESLLKDNDPLFQYTFSELNSANRNELSDSYMYYRQSRMNYWAVKAIQARMYLYLGKKDKAYMLAKEIIEAKGADGGTGNDYERRKLILPRDIKLARRNVCSISVNMT